MSLPVAGVGGCTELSASPLSQEPLRRLPWCTCVSASASQSRAQSCARELCCKILFSHDAGYLLGNVCVCVSLVRVVIICLASTHTALVSSPSLAVLHLSTYLPIQ